MLLLSALLLMIFIVENKYQIYKIQVIITNYKSWLKTEMIIFLKFDRQKNDKFHLISRSIL